MFYWHVSLWCLLPINVIVTMFKVTATVFLLPDTIHESVVQSHVNYYVAQSLYTIGTALECARYPRLIATVPNLITY